MKTKDRPILFSAPMVRALLDGSKTQTRRVVKRSDEWPASAVKAVMLESRGTALAVAADRCTYGPEISCFYGQPGDRLWVRETYWIDDEDNAIIYRADKDADIVDTNRHETGSKKYNWKPSIFMPRAASRITLEITGVRVERLQDITRGDSMSEGCPFPNMAQGDNPCQWYEQLWGQINGADSWAANPWVWVIEFKKADQ